MHRSPVRSLVVSLPAIVALAACASMPGFSSKKSDGLSRVDELLSQVERVQVESVVAKERSDAALAALETMVDTEFDGDPVIAYQDLDKSLDESRTQAKKLSGSVQPMKSLADDVFEEWTASLESFGNTKMRQRSQARLEATRARYHAVLESAVAAQIAYDSFNADVADHALFLEHDFNAEAVQMIAGDVESLGDQKKELDSRLDHCVAATKKYVENAALRGQLEQPAEEAKPRRAAENAQQPRARQRAAKTEGEAGTTAKAGLQ